MWAKFVIIFALLYIFTVVQNSFLAHFSIFGAVPNMVLIFYFIIAFTEKPNRYIMGLFSAITAGLLLDISTSSLIGPSVLILTISLFLLKKVLRILWDRTGKYEAVYFCMLFSAMLFYYWFCSNMVFFLFEPGSANFSLDWTFWASLLYNLAVAFIMFFIFNKISISKDPDRQLKLL